MRTETITLAAFGESMHLTPKRQEGYLYTAEEVYEMFPKQKPDKEGGKTEIPVRGIAGGSSWDDHSKWEIVGEGGETREVWMRRVADAAAIASGTDPDHPNDGLPPCIERILRELRRPRIDWRTMLNDFVQEEICDYSYSPPDRRFSESAFFLPDFNDTEVKVENVLFMVDTSASITDEMIRVADSEIKGAIDQFGGKLKGWLGFFDAGVVEPQPFEDVEDVLKIKPAGGGGTDFGIVFVYVHCHMQEQPPACIVILTDGFAPYPPEAAANGIPVLWLINNETSTPPWGKLARIRCE
jgi:predicted metal-dependent peptidase